MVHSLGAGSELVGRSHECDYPSSVTLLPVVSRPSLDLDGASPEAIDAFNERLLIALQRDGSSYLSNATLNGRFALRGCVLNYRTTLRDMEILLDDLRRVAKSLPASGEVIPGGLS